MTNYFKQLFGSGEKSDKIAMPGSLTELKDLLVLSQMMTSARDMDQVLSFLLGEIHKRFSIECGVMGIDDKDDTFKVRAHRGFTAPMAREFTIQLGSGPLGLTYSENRKHVFKRVDFFKAGARSYLLDSEGWESFMVAPLSVHNENLGLFIAGSKETNFFTPSVLHLLDCYLQILCVGMRNAELMARMEKFNRRLEAEVSSTTEELTRTNERLIHRVRELKALYEITLSGSANGTLKELLNVVCSRVQELMGVDHVVFFINQSSSDDRADLQLEHSTLTNAPVPVNTWRIQSDDSKPRGPLSQIILDSFRSNEVRVHHGSPLPIEKEFSHSTSAPQADSHTFRSIVSVPLKTSQKTAGIMVLMNPVSPDAMPDGKVKDEFTEEKMRTLTLIANRVATSLENVQLTAEIKKRLADLSTLQEVSEILYASPIFELDLAKIVKIILKSLSCDSCAFLIFDAAQEKLVTSASESSIPDDAEPAEQTLDTETEAALRVYREGKSRILNEDPSGPVKTQSVASLLFVPLKVEKDVIGVLKLGSHTQSFFNEHHQRLAELVSDRAAVVVQNSKLYDKILNANRELERLNRVKTEFVSMVSHELRTPLTAIKGFVDVVMTEEAGPVNEQQKRFLRIAHNSIDRLAMIISDLLDISRIESGQLKLEFTRSSLEKVLKDAMDTFRTSIEGKQIALTLEIEKKLPEVYSDEMRVKQVVDNLLSNAMKFTQAGGHIRVIADDMGDFLLVSIADTGIGIKKEDQEKIFERFYQVDSSLTRQVGGTGLGLAICKTIIEKHGGRIWVESEHGKGSTFRFLIPRVRKWGTEEEAARHKDEKTSSHKQAEKAPVKIDPHSGHKKDGEMKHK